MGVITTISTALSGAKEQGQSALAASEVPGAKRAAVTAAAPAVASATSSTVVTLGRAHEPALTYDAGLAQSVESLRVGIARYMSEGA